MKPVSSTKRLPPTQSATWVAARGLLARNPDNYQYHEGLRGALRLAPDTGGAWTPQQRAQLAGVYAGLAAAYPRSSASQRIPLDFTVGTV